MIRVKAGVMTAATRQKGRGRPDVAARTENDCAES
jgi:hypothetical protein